MKRKKLSQMSIEDGELKSSNNALSREEMKHIIGGTCGHPLGCGAGGGGECNCLYCFWTDGGLTTYYSSCTSDPYSACTFYGWPRIVSNASYGIC